MVLVTLGVCVKNSEKTIEDAIDCILEQDFPMENIELIIVDGYSSDNTLQIIKRKLQGKSRRFEILLEKKGLGFARQLVAERARGKYVIYVDGDMVMAKDFVSKQVEFMEQNPGVGMAIGRFQIPPKSNWIANLESIVWVTEDQLLSNKMFSKPVRATTCGAIFRLDALKQSGGFDSEIKGAGEDIDVVCKLSEKGWLVYSTTDAFFCDKRKERLKTLMREHFWYGYGSHYVIHKHKKCVPIRLSRILYFTKAYRITKRKIAFLLPFIYVFEKTAELLGYAKAHLDNYGHK
jgi:glycosyltransferase involved in cell wall biosynthesis